MIYDWIYSLKLIFEQNKWQCKNHVLTHNQSILTSSKN